jgi:hypothetical protein
MGDMEEDINRFGEEELYLHNHSPRDNISTDIGQEGEDKEKTREVQKLSSPSSFEKEIEKINKDIILDRLRLDTE